MKKNFTLTEMVVVIVVLSILAAIIVAVVGNIKKDSITSHITSNMRILQTASDTYSLKNNGKYPTRIQPTLENPQFIDIDKLYPKYIKSKPDLNKIKEQRYWIDVFGQVWGGTADSPTDIYETENFIEWNYKDKVTAYNLYELQNNEATGSVSVKKIRLNKNIPVKKAVDIIQVEKQGSSFLISAVDEYGLESAPAGLNYLGKEDWFTPMLNKEGSYVFEIESADIMYWDSFRAVEEKPEGTSITYRFSTLQDGNFTEWTEDFNSIESSKHLKIEVTLKGHNGKNPSLYDLRVFYHFDNFVAPEHTVIQRENLNSEGKVINPQEPVRVVDQFILPSDQKVTEIKNTDWFSIINTPETNIYYKENDQFIPIPSITDVPAGSTVQVERKYPKGEDLFVQVPFINTVKHDEFTSLNGNNPEDTVKPIVDAELVDPEWKTINTLSFFAHSGDGEITHWLNMVADDVKPEHTRILYRFSAGNWGYWMQEYDALSKVPDSRSLRVKAYLQVKTSEVGKVQEPEVKGIKIQHERGVADLSLVKPTLVIKPIKSNNKDNGFFSTETKVQWSYEAADPKNREITQVEWSGDRREQYPIGTYEVSARVLNSSNYWSDWVTYKFEVKSEQPVALIKNAETSFEEGTTINWESASYDPDGDGIAQLEWAGDYKNSYTSGNYSLKLRVQDNEGNWSNWVEKTFTVYEKSYITARIEAEDTLNVAISGIQYIQTNAEASGGKIVERNTDGNSSPPSHYSKFTMNGTGFDIRFYNRIYADIHVDGVKIETVDQTAPSRFETYRVRNLSAGTHTVEIKYIGWRKLYHVDYFDIVNPATKGVVTDAYIKNVNTAGQESFEKTTTLIGKDGNQSKIYYTIDKHSYSTIVVKNESGQIVQTLVNNEYKTAGTINTYSTIWDGKDNNGSLVNSGAYTIEIKLKSPYSNETSIKTLGLTVDNAIPVYRIEAEDTANVSTLGHRTVTNHAQASNGQYVLINTDGNPTPPTHNFKFKMEGTGFDIRFYSRLDAYIYVDGVIVERVTQSIGNTFATHSIRGLSNGVHDIDVRLIGYRQLNSIDYFDVYNTNYSVGISNIDTYSLSTYNAQSLNQNQLLIPYLNSKSKIYYTLNKNGYITARVKNSAGTVVRDLFSNELKTAGTFNRHSVVWDGKNNSGDFVSDGNYIVEFVALDLLKGTTTTFKETIEVMNTRPSYKIEAEDTTKVSSAGFQSIQADANASGGKVVYKNTDGNGSPPTHYTRFTMTGTGFDLGFKSRIHGYVYVDGQLIEEAYLTNASQYDTYFIRNLNSGTHTVEIRWIGYRQINYIDYFNIIP